MGFEKKISRRSAIGAIMKFLGAAVAVTSLGNAGLNELEARNKKSDKEELKRTTDQAAELYVSSSVAEFISRSEGKAMIGFDHGNNEQLVLVAFSEQDCIDALKAKKITKVFCEMSIAHSSLYKEAEAGMAQDVFVESYLALFPNAKEWAQQASEQDQKEVRTNIRANYNAIRDLAREGISMIPYDHRGEDLGEHTALAERKAKADPAFLRLLIQEQQRPHPVAERYAARLLGGQKAEEIMMQKQRHRIIKRLRAEKHPVMVEYDDLNKAIYGQDRKNLDYINGQLAPGEDCLILCGRQHLEHKNTLGYFAKKEGQVTSLVVLEDRNTLNKTEVRLGDVKFQGGIAPDYYISMKSGQLVSLGTQNLAKQDKPRVLSEPVSTRRDFLRLFTGNRSNTPA